MQYLNKNRCKNYLALILFVLGNVLFVTCSFAEEIRDYYSEPGLQPYKEDLSQGLNEHIDPFSGILQIKHTDLVIPGNGGMDIIINRVYTSLSSVRYPSRMMNGFGWVLHFGRIVVPDGYEDRICSQGSYSANTRDNPSVEWSDGSRELLVLSSEIGDGQTLITRSNVRARCNPSGGGLVVTKPDGTEFTMDYPVNFENDHYWLTTRIQDVHGNFIRIEYDTINNLSLAAGYPSAIYRSEEGESDPVVTFEYEGEGYDLRLHSVTANGQAWTYAYSPVEADYAYPVFNLSEVQRPDGKKWLYEYNPLLPDSSPDDEVNRPDPGSFSLRQMTYPNGAVVQYGYQYVSFDSGTHTVIHTKTLSGDDIDGGEWLFEFAPKSRFYTSTPGGDLRLDVTTVTTPQSRIVYTHYGLDFTQELVSGGFYYHVFRPTYIGLLQMKEIYDLNDNLLERREYVWSERHISNENYFHGNVSRTETYLQWDTYAAIPIAEMVNRDDNQPGGGGYTVSGGNYTSPYSYSNALLYHYDRLEFGNPTSIEESNYLQGENNRITRYNYQHDTTAWILGLVIQESIYDGPLLAGAINRSYYPSGKLESEDRFGVITEYEYHLSGDLLSVTDANQNAKQYQNYKRGQAQLEIWPEEITISRVINDTGTIASQTNGRELTTNYTYDDLNRVESIDFPQGYDVTISYGSSISNQRTLTRGNYQQIDYFDSIGKLKRVVRRDNDSGEIIETRYQYDQLGRKTFESYPGNSEGTNFYYDALDRISRVENIDDSSIRFRFYDWYSVQIDELLRETTYIYRQYGVDYSNRGVAQINQPESIGTIIQTDVLGNTTDVFQGELQEDNGVYGFGRYFTYNSKKFLETELHPEISRLNNNNYIRYTYDNVGNLLSKTVGDSQATNYEYDDLNRLELINYPTAADVSYIYSETGKIKSVISSVASRIYSYDDNDNLSGEDVTIGANTYSVHYDIDNMDFISAITYPSTRRIEFAPNAFGRPTQAMPYVTAAQYYPGGQLRQMTYANGQVTNITLTQRLWTEALSSQSDVIAMDIAYDYDDVGNVREIRDQVLPVRNRNLDYDDVNRLVSATGGWGNHAYDYESVGDIKSGETKIRSYSDMVLGYIRDSVTGRTVNSFTHDKRGNIIIDDQRGVNLYNYGRYFTYAYNDADELITARSYFSLSNSFLRPQDIEHEFMFNYDGEHQRIQRIHSNQINYFLYAMGGRLLGEYDQLGVAAGKEFFYLGNQLIAKAYDPDIDGDQIDDAWELQYFGSLDRDGSGDFEPDGVDDLREFINQTNPLLNDSDGDGLSDDYEISNSLDPAQGDNAYLDSDDDGFSDRQEAFAGTSIEFDTDYPEPGQLIRTADISTNISPVVGDDGTLYVISDNGLRAYFPNGTPKWEFYHADNTIHTPVLAEGRIYITSSRSITAVNLAGKFLWRWTVPNTAFETLASAPAVGSDGTVFIGSASSSGGRRAAAYAISSEGNLLWDYRISPTFSIDLTPAIAADGTVYFTSSIGQMWTLSPTGVLKWVFGGAQGDFLKSLVIGRDGIIYQISGSARLYAISSSGVPLWDIWDYGEFNGYPVIGEDGSIYVAGNALNVVSDDGSNISTYPGFSSSTFVPAIADDGTIYVIGDGDLHALTPDFTQKWVAPLSSVGSTPTAGPVIDKDGTIYVPTTTGLQYFVDARNAVALAPAWSTYGHDRTRSSNQCRFNDAFYAPDDDADSDQIPDCVERINGLNPEDPSDAGLDADDDGLINLQEYLNGTRINSSDSDGDGISDGEEILTLFSNALASDTDGDGISDYLERQWQFNLLDNSDGAIDADNDGFSNRQEVMLGTNPREPSVYPVKGTPLWSIEYENGTLSLGLDDTLYRTNGSVVSAYHPSGKIKWAYSTGTEKIMGSAVVGHEGTLYVASYVPASGTGYYYSSLHILGSDGSPTAVIQAKAYTYFSSSPAIDSSGNIYVGTNRGMVSYDAHGVERWTLQKQDVDILNSINVERMQKFDKLYSPVIGFDGSVYARGATGWLYSIDSESGQINWKLPMPPGTENSMALGIDGEIYVPASTGIMYAINADGSYRWRYKSNLGLVSSRVIVGPDEFLYFTTKGEESSSLQVLRPDGSLAWTLPLGMLYSSQLILAEDGTVYVIASSVAGVEIMAVSLASQSVIATYPVTTDPLTVPGYLLGTDGTLYVGNQAYADNTGGLATSAWPMMGRDARATGNICLIQNQTYPVNADTDGDLISDCRELHHQLNPLMPDDADSSLDTDMLSNRQETGLGTSLRRIDTDGDGLNDDVEFLEISSSPIMADSDSDGVNDAAESALGTSSLIPADALFDYDGDGFSNRQEVMAGTLPNDPGSAPSRGALMQYPMPDELAAMGPNHELYFLAGKRLIATNNDGSMKWALDLGTNNLVSQVLVSTEGIIYLSVAASSSTPRYYLLALASDGTELWRRSDSGTPVALGQDGTIYTSRSGNMQAINPGTRSVIWSYPGTSVSLGIDGSAYITSTNSIRAIDSNGSEFAYYTFTGHNSVTKVTVAANGMLYIGGYIPSAQNYIYELNPSNLAITRSYPTGISAATGAVYISSDNNFYFSQDCVLTALNADFGFKWSRPGLTDAWGTCYLGPIALAADGSIVMSSGETVLSLSSDNQELWSYSVPIESGVQPYWRMPRIDDDGTVYISVYGYFSGTWKTQPYAFADTNRGLDSGGWPMAGYDLRNSSSAQGSLNASPVVLISAPQNGSAFTTVDNISLIATATDLEDGNLSSAITWSSDIDSALGSGAGLSVSLTEATHIITAAVTDSSGLTHSAQVSIVVESADRDDDGMLNVWEVNYGMNPDDPSDAQGDLDGDGFTNLQEFTNGTVPNDAAPTVTITAPGNGALFAPDTVINLTAAANDSEDGDLSAAITWSSDVDGSLGTGAMINTALSRATHAIFATVTDSAGGMPFNIPSITITIGATGDVNNDGVTNAIDVLLLEKHLLGTDTLDTEAIERADLYPQGTGDGAITVSDLLLLQKRVMGGAQ